MRRLGLVTVVLSIFAALLVVVAPSSASASATELSLPEAIASLKVADESRAGYQRTSFKHWVDEDKDGCSTRNEVLIVEAKVKPTVGARCAISGGEWFSYYDSKTVTSAGGLDIDHMVPLAEAWDSGASQWDAAKRERYANDLGDDRSLIAVTAASNRSKSDQDPAEWLPPSVEVKCRYLSEWVATKLRWALTINAAERDALTQKSEGCTDKIVVNPA